MTAMSDTVSYRSLGVLRVINARATVTGLGGSLMLPSTVQVMADAAASFVDLEELHRKVGERLALATRNEAAYVSTGAAAGIVLVVTACLVGVDATLRSRLPDASTLERNEVIIQRGQRTGYDASVRQTGARIVEVDPTPDALAAALSERTAAVLYFAGNLARGALALESVVAAALRQAVPVIVDAAAQIPPLSSLWHFTQEVGADVAIFSGGKGLRGPQASGLVVGRRAIIDGCRAAGSPNPGIGRPMKVGKEELMGLLAAVESALEADEDALLAGYEASVAMWLAELSQTRGVSVERGFPSEAGQPHGLALIRLDASAALTRDEVVEALWNRDPRIAVGTFDADGIWLNPQTLEPGEDRLVLRALSELLEDPAPRQALGMPPDG